MRELCRWLLLFSLVVLLSKQETESRHLCPQIAHIANLCNLNKMEGVQAVEGELNAIVKEVKVFYLKIRFVRRRKLMDKISISGHA